jgi:hypothetical protein
MSPVLSSITRLWALAMFLTIPEACMGVQAPGDDELGRLAGERRERVMQFQRVQIELENELLGELGRLDVLHDQLNRELTRQVRYLDAEYRLTDAQKTKLLLAGRGDVKRVLDRYEAIKKRHERAAGDLAFLKLHQDAASFRADLDRGSFGGGSLFLKTVATTITDEQRKGAETRRTQHDLARYRADVADAAARLAPALGLSDEQERRLVKFLIDEIDPPREIGEADNAYIMFRFSQIPEAKIKPIFSDSQWQSLCQMRSSWKTRDSLLKRGVFELLEGPAARAGTKQIIERARSKRAAKNKALPQAHDD